MSQAEAPESEAPGTDGPPRRLPRRWSLGLLRSEIGTAFLRWRTLALLAVLAGVPVLVGIAVKIETGRGGASGGSGGGEGGPAFISQVTNNGLFLVFTSLAVT